MRCRARWIYGWRWPETSVVEDAIEDGGSQHAVVVEDGWPVLVGLVGGQHDRAALVALADDLEQQVCPAFVDGQVAQLINDEKLGSGSYN
jgi:hypothetical protein